MTAKASPTDKRVVLQEILEQVDDKKYTEIEQENFSSESKKINKNSTQEDRRKMNKH